jgi:hypothetical protein
MTRQTDHLKGCLPIFRCLLRTFTRSFKPFSQLVAAAGKFRIIKCCNMNRIPKHLRYIATGT